MNDPRDYKLEISSLKQSESAKTKSSPRPYLQALFECCNVYQRIYRNADGKLYDGACPRCGKRVRFVVGEGGTNCRAFVIS